MMEAHEGEDARLEDVFLEITERADAEDKREKERVKKERY